MVESTGGASRIVVAETGNRRTNISDEDLTQCIKDLASWFQTNAASHYEQTIAPRANAAAADQVGSVLAEFASAGTGHLALSLQKFNGGMQYLDTYVGISVDEINTIGN